jgi:acyl carrier protein
VPYELRYALAEVAGIDAKKIRKTRVLARLAPDEAALARLRRAVEDALEVNLEDEDFRELRTVEDLATYVAEEWASIRWRPVDKGEAPVADVFTAEEHAILATYLGTRVPHGVRDFQPSLEGALYGEEPYDDDAYCWESWGIWLTRRGRSDEVEEVFKRVVGRLVLRDMQERLPAWQARNPDTGETYHSRAHAKRTRGKHRTALLARSLFGFNWADSGPGYSWPELFHLVYVPIYDVYIVTRSDEEEDVALATIQPREPAQDMIESACYRCIEDFAERYEEAFRVWRPEGVVRACGGDLVSRAKAQELIEEACRNVQRSVDGLPEEDEEDGQALGG